MAIKTYTSSSVGDIQYNISQLGGADSQLGVIVPKLAPYIIGAFLNNSFFMNFTGRMLQPYVKEGMKVNETITYQKIQTLANVYDLSSTDTFTPTTQPVVPETLIIDKWQGSSYSFNQWDSILPTDPGSLWSEFVRNTIAPIVNGMDTRMMTLATSANNVYTLTGTPKKGTGTCISLDDLTYIELELFEQNNPGGLNSTYAMISPWDYAELVNDTTLSSVDKAGTILALWEGRLPTVRGFNLIRNNNIVYTTNTSASTKSYNNFFYNKDAVQLVTLDLTVDRAMDEMIQDTSFVTFYDQRSGLRVRMRIIGTGKTAAPSVTVAFDVAYAMEMTLPDFAVLAVSTQSLA